MKSVAFLFTVAISLLAILSACGQEVVNEFKRINDGLIVQNNFAEMKNSALRDSVQQFVQNVELKDKLSVFDAQRREYRQFLANLKLNLVENAKGIDSKTGELKQPDNIDVATIILVDNHKADTLYYKMISLHAQMSSLAITDQTKTGLQLMVSSTKEKTSAQWAKSTFYHIPVTAAVTILSKFENDIQQAEKMLLRDLLYNAK